MTLSGTDFEHRFDDLARLAYRVAYRLLGSRPDAEDVAQETLARAAVRWRKVEPYAEAWITRVATNLALGQIRRRRGSRSPEPPNSQTPRFARSGPEAGHDGANVEERDALVAGLLALPRRQREVLALRYLGDLSEAQTAEALGCSVGSVKQHAVREASPPCAATSTSIPPPTIHPETSMFDQLDDPEGFTPSDAFRGAVRRRTRHLVRRRRARRVAVAVAGALPVLGLAAVAVGLDRRLDSVQRVDIGNEGGADPLDTGAPVTILVLGTDAAPNDPARSQVVGTRADVIVVVRIEHGRVSTLSIPRDLWTGTQKIDALSSADLSAWLHEQLGIHVDHLVSMDMERFADLAGRIRPRVRVDLPIRDRNAGLALEAGCQALDGDQVLAYVRARHLQDLPGDPNSWRSDPTGDLGRIARTGRGR